MSNVKVIYPHDPLCPSLNCIDSGCGDCCRCELIAKVRQDERERAGIEQTVPSYEYPFSTAVTVEVDMNRYMWTAFGPWLDEDGPFVLHAEAEAAIAAARQQGAESLREQTRMDDWPTQQQDAYARGQRDMLAKCIAAVDARIRPTLHPLENAGIGEALAALRALEEKP